MTARPRSFLLAGFLWLLVFVLAVVEAVGYIAVDWHKVPRAIGIDSSTIVGAVTVVVMSTVGWLVAVRRPGNIVGWLMLSIAVTGAVISVPQMYAAYAVYVHPGALPGAFWVYWFGQFIWVVLLGQLILFLPLVFPDGRLLSRRWLIAIGLFATVLVLSVIAAFDPAATAPLPNPAAIKALSGLYKLEAGLPFTLYFLGVCSLGIVSLFVRYRRGDDQERQQLKWLLVAVAVLLAGLLIQIFVAPLANLPLLPITAAALPIAIGIAVLRYRLYDIDLIINKTLVYGGLAVLITAVYVVVVVGVGAFVSRGQQLLLSLLTTAIIALAFQPLRQRAQRLANRLVYGKRATPYETLSEFSEHLSQTFSQEDILDRMSRILAQGTGAERAEVWVRAGSHLLLASSSPPSDGAVRAELPMDNGTLPVLERDRVAPVSHQGELLGALAITKKRGETMNAVEDKLVTDLAGQAGLVLRNAGLNRELLARLEDLRASRQRLVTAQDEERRRIERNLHDGAQQHLVALKVKLGLAEAAAAPDSKVRGMLSQLKVDADDALDTMRELARGIYPPLLASEGLATALRAQARRVPIPVELQIEEPGRYPKEIEGAVFFCVLEALQNVTKYAEAKTVEVRLWKADRQLAFAVHDNGKGFDPATVGPTSGIQKMRDRLEALGGSLALRSEPGRGTTIEGRVATIAVAAAR
jgi:signal transduction histidine kinase